MSSNRVALIQLSAFVGAMLLLPHLLLIPFAKTQPVQFDNQQSLYVHKNLPEVVLLGNSMLKTRIKSKDFGNALGRKSLALPMGGSGSTRWYLSFKNSVLPASNRTRELIIFFRDHEIIDPLFRTQNQYRNAVAKMKVGPEPELSRIQEQSQNWRERAWDWIYRNSWAIRVHRNQRNSFATVAIRDSFPSRYRAQLMKLTKSRFEVENLRPDLNFEPEELGRPPVGDPKTAIEKSLLPEILKLAKANKIQLILYRISRRPGEPEVRPDYVDALKKYSNEQGIKYLEEREIFGTLPLDWYADGDHVRPSVKKEYSIRLGEKLKQVLQ